MASYTTPIIIDIAMSMVQARGCCFKKHSRGTLSKSKLGFQFVIVAYDLHIMKNGFNSQSSKFSLQPIEQVEVSFQTFHLRPVSKF